MSKLKELLIKFKSEILYLIFGALATLANIVSYYVFYNILHCSNFISTVIAWLLSVLLAYFTNRVFVFESKQNGLKNVLREMAAFFTCRILTGIMDVVIMLVTVDVMNWNSMLWKIISNILVIVLNYFASKVFIFKNKE